MLVPVEHGNHWTYVWFWDVLHVRHNIQLQRNVQILKNNQEISVDWLKNIILFIIVPVIIKSSNEREVNNMKLTINYKKGATIEMEVVEVRVDDDYLQFQEYHRTSYLMTPIIQVPLPAIESYEITK